MGGWQTCSATCGPDGVRKRTILCVRTVAGEERVLHPGDCKQLLKPKPVISCNRDVLCGFEWMVGNWSEVGTFNVVYVLYLLLSTCQFFYSDKKPFVSSQNFCYPSRNVPFIQKQFL